MEGLQRMRQAPVEQRDRLGTGPGSGFVVRSHRHYAPPAARDFDEVATGVGEWVERFADNGERARSRPAHTPAKVPKWECPNRRREGSDP